MVGRDKIFTVATPGVGVLIAVWYLLLLYIFPFSLPYSEWEPVLLLMSGIYFVLFAVIVCSLAIFAIRLIKLGGQPAASDPTLDTDALRAHFLSSLRMLIALSLLVCWVRLIRNVREDELLISLAAATVFVVAVSSALSRLVVGRTGSLLERRWSPEGWLAALVVLGTAASLFTNFLDLAQESWGLVRLVFTAPTSTLEAALESLNLDGVITLIVLLFWMMVLYYVIVLWTRWRSLLEDCSVLIEKLMSLRRKAAK